VLITPFIISQIYYLILAKKPEKDLKMTKCVSPNIDKKQSNIALFKRGFGGYFKENFRGIKYFSEEDFKKDAKNFIDNYSKLFYEPR